MKYSIACSVTQFNLGKGARMFVELGKHGRKIAAAVDETRISLSLKRESQKEERSKKRQKKIEEEDKKEKAGRSHLRGWRRLLESS